LSQLRFSADDRPTWGINLARFVRRRNEEVWAELVPKNESGLASRMGHLVGLDGIRPSRHLELVPYVASRGEFIAPASSGNPFNDGSQLFGSMGLDVKAGLGGSFTLDATINPDFGQAEVDPAVVNLSAFETFFAERRRFFIEGAEIFNTFGTGGANNFFGFNTVDPDVFYSRRIGRAPTGSADGDFVEAPRATTILGAVKLTGKTPGGWSVGFVEAVTSRERARVLTGGVGGRADVEPASNYAAVRVLREFTRAGIGMLATSVRRRLDTPVLAAANVRRAEVIGGDGYYFFDRDRDWVVTGKLSGSYVAGSREALLELQRAPQRYFQRPDAAHLAEDGSRTSLRGYAGRVNLNRNSGVWRANASLWGVSPGFESNDLGFHNEADRAGGHGVLLWVNQSPNRVTREHVAWIAKGWSWNFDRELTSDLWFGCSDATFLNYWSVGACAAHFGSVLDDRLTRGGPAVVIPAGRMFSVAGGSDQRKWLAVRLNVGRDWNDAGGEGLNSRLEVNLKPLSSLTISTGPSVNRSTNVAQYLRTEPSASSETSGARYVFGEIRQTEVTLTTRVSYVMSPRASLQVFMQPLLSTGDYSRFKELARGRTFDFNVFGDNGSSIARDGGTGMYTVLPSLTLPDTFSFDDPDFNFKSLRLNAVFRWEFRPGSTLYAVWTEMREDLSSPGTFRFGRDASALFGAPSDDILLFKIAWWIGR
jgi:hypothetical protein